MYQAHQQRSGYTSLTAGSRRLRHEASLTLLLLSEFIIFIHFMDHHFRPSARTACWSRARETRGADSGVLGTDRLLQPLRLPFPLDLSECHLYFQSCCRLYLLLGYSESRRPSCLHKVSLYTTLGVSSGKPDGNTSSEFTAVPLSSYRDCSQTQTLKRDLWTCKCP